MNVLRNLTLSFAFYSKIDTFSHFKQKFKIFRETYLFFLKSKNDLNILRKLPISVAFHSKIATFSHFKMTSFFWRIHVHSYNSQIWTFWEMLVFQLNSTAKLLPPANFYTFKIFVQKTHFFILEKPEVWIFWRLLEFQSILRQVCCFCHFKRHQFFSKNRSIL